MLQKQVLVVQDFGLHQLSWTGLPLHASNLWDRSVCLPKLLSLFESVSHASDSLSLQRSYSSGMFVTTH